MMNLTLKPASYVNYYDALYVYLEMDETEKQIVIANHLNQIQIFGPEWSQKLHGITIGDISERQVRLSVSRKSIAKLAEIHLISVIEQIDKIVRHLMTNYDEFQQQPTMLRIHLKKHSPMKPVFMAAE